MDVTSIVRLLKKIDISTFTAGSHNVYAECPLATWQHPNGRDDRPSMSIKVNPVGDSPCMCWSAACGWTGTFVQLIKMRNHFAGGKYDEAVELAESLERSDLQARLDAIFNPEPEDETEVTFDDGMLLPFARRVPRYAIDPPPKGRGLTIDACKYWELGFDETGNRLVVPVRNTEHDLVGLMGRSIYAEQQPKWLAYWNFKKGQYLYGEDKVDQTLDKVIVVEGMPDVWTPWQYGIRNVVALLGSKLTTWHERKLLRWGLPVYWMLDGDDAGRKGTAQCVGQLRGKIRQFTVICAEGKDPGKIVDKQEFDDTISRAEFVL